MIDQHKTQDLRGKISATISPPTNTLTGGGVVGVDRESAQLGNSEGCM